MSTTPVTVDVLDGLPEGAVIVDAHGLAKQKNRGRWRAWFDKSGSSGALMLDPDHSAQPLSVVWVPEDAT